MTQLLERQYFAGYSADMLRHLVPDERVSSVIDIDPEALSAKGIRGLILDLDDTLVDQFEKTPTEAVCSWLARAKGSLRIFILSNNRSKRRVAPVADFFEVPFIHLALKPLPFGFLKCLKLMGLQAGEVAVVGDQLFTDVLGGRRLGAYTILVAPMSATERRWGRKLMRRAELAVLSRRSLRMSRSH